VSTVRVNEIAFVAHPVTAQQRVKDPDGNAFFIHKRKPGHG